jgi:proteasome accessory factor A
MADCLMGVETEYAITSIRGQEAADPALVVRRLLELAHAALPHVLDGGSSGLFLENAARLYLDHGLHIEYATPECANPWDAVRYVESGHRTMLDLVQKFAKSRPEEEETGCFRVNVDYSGFGTSWGCHESYLHKMPPEELPDQLIPHLVSRVIYTGAGGFEPLSGGLRFTLSPRASHIERAISDDSIDARGIFHTKNEPLCAGYHRLHVLCGESLCSHLAMFVRFGATSLVVAMAEAGLRPGKDVQLVSAIEAWRSVSRDPTCKTKLRVKGSSGMTAIEIQRHYLTMAEAHLGDSFMPPWASTVCTHWRRVLDRLEDGPGAVNTMLDWAIKLSLYVNHASRQALDWDRLPFWSDVVDRLRSALNAPDEDEPFALDLAIGPLTSIPEVVAELRELVASKGLHWDELRQVLALRAEFLETDIRFGQLGPRGVFTTLDAAGILDHRVDGVDNIEHAVLNPPSSGRAQLRGAVIKRVAGDKEGEWYGDWHQVFSRTHGRLLDLSDPFAPAESWHDIPRGKVRFPESEMPMNDLDSPF